MDKFLKITSILFLLFSSQLFSKAELVSSVNQDLGQMDQITIEEFVAISSVDLVAKDFRGIVGLSNCSGSIISLEGRSLDSKALLLTNGHCIVGGFLDPGEVLINKASVRSVSLLNKNAKKIATLKTSKILYGTMSKTDMALYEMDITYKQLATKYKINPLMLDSSAPAKAEKIKILSGYWKKEFNCYVDKIIFEMKESRWTWNNSIKYTKACKTYGGTSGSPIISESSGKVIGVNNTGNERGGQCTLNNPCEVDEDGKVTIDKGNNYGQNTFWIYGCLKNNNVDKLSFNFQRSGCELLGPQ